MLRLLVDFKPRHPAKTFRRALMTSSPSRRTTIMDEHSNAAANMPTEEAAPLTMQIVVRRDLLDAEGWGVGPLLTQAAHATAAVLHEFRDLETTQAYLSDLKSMRKVTLQVSDEGSLRKLEKLLQGADPPIAHYLWIEQPENVATCLALAPNDRGRVIRKALDKGGCRLWRG